MATKRTNGKNGKRRRVRYAVVGQGFISQVAVLPAFANARKSSELVALVSGDPTKRKKLAKKYGIERTYGYDEYDECLASGEVDAVYIALPNHMHHDYTIRAARAGVHVLCEKPMAVTEVECEEMIEEAVAGRVKLMIAYRLHFEAANLRAVALVRSGKIGDPRVFTSTFTMQVKDEGNIRLQRDKGGGTLYDIGIYCIHAARSAFADEPLEATGLSVSGREERFAEVDEATGAVLHFPDDRVATFVSSFGAFDRSSYRVIGTKGEVEVSPAFEMAEALRVRWTVGGRTKAQTFRKHDQFAPELLYFSRCILEDLQPEPSGAEGLADVRVIRALYDAAERGQTVALPPPDDLRTKHPSSEQEQEIYRPAGPRPDLLEARPPSQE